MDTAEGFTSSLMRLHILGLHIPLGASDGLIHNKQTNSNNMNVVLTNAGSEVEVDLPLGSRAGAIRGLIDDLEEIGAPSTYTLSVNGVAVEDDHMLTPGARVAFRPVAGQKG